MPPLPGHDQGMWAEAEAEGLFFIAVVDKERVKGKECLGE